MEQKQEEVATIMGLGERQKTFVEQQKKVSHLFLSRVSRFVETWKTLKFKLQEVTITAVVVFCLFIDLFFLS